MKEIFVKSSVDNTLQPSLFHFSGEENRPMLVGLHTWSYERDNQVTNMLPYAEKYNWNLLLPEFRGANLASNPNCRDACGSGVAIQDIFDAIEYVTANYKIDSKKIFLLGCSGGGHMALLTTAKNSEMFKAVGAFVPITDLITWHRDSNSYSRHIEACLGGAPNADNIEIYKERSPICYLDDIAKANVKIFHGRYDNVVSVKQSMDFYNCLYERHQNARVFLDIFDGGHEMDMETAFYWFLSQLNTDKLISVTG